jgi:uncharacterized protein YodC (DUF2158 family)
METLYRRIEIKEGNSTEPVQYVGVYALNWQKEWGEPEAAFVEEELQPQEQDVEQFSKGYEQGMEHESQEQVTVGNLQDLLIKHGKSYQGGYKILVKDFKQAAQAIHSLVYGEKGGKE